MADQPEQNTGAPTGAQEPSTEEGSAAGQTASAGLSPLEIHEREHAARLEEKRRSDAEKLKAQMKASEEELARFNAERQKRIEEQKKQNLAEEKAFLETKRTASPWVAAADMSDFQAPHTKDVDRIRATMLRLKTQGAPSEAHSAP